MSCRAVLLQVDGLSLAVLSHADRDPATKNCGFSEKGRTEIRHHTQVVCKCLHVGALIELDSQMLSYGCYEQTCKKS